PENSRAAIAAALSAGYGIEIDLQASADGVAMVFHDDHLDRLTRAKGLVAARTRAELTRLRLRGTSERIPTLREVLALVEGRVPLLVEIKDQSGNLGPADGRLEADTAKALADYKGPVAVMSFNPHSMAAMTRLAPNIPRGLVTCAFAPEDWPDVPPARRAELASLAAVSETGASFISHDWRALGMDAVAKLKAQGLPVLCWTIRSPAQEAEARQVADNITFEGYTP
ncbi:MAG: phosphodiesterase, partial [Rhodobacteraceae bacterium]|nr:phosphodiesterase [Paracoccaceae bacterium]